MRNNRKTETVGSVVEKLVKFPFHTEMLTECLACQRGSAGGSVEVIDMTDQTFGYVSLEVNRIWIDRPHNDTGLGTFAVAQIQEMKREIEETKLKGWDLSTQTDLLGKLIYLVNGFETKRVDVLPSTSIRISREQAQQIKEKYAKQELETSSYSSNDSGSYWPNGYLSAFDDLSDILGINLIDLIYKLTEEKEDGD